MKKILISIAALLFLAACGTDDSLSNHVHPLDMTEREAEIAQLASGGRELALFDFTAYGFGLFEILLDVYEYGLLNEEKSASVLVILSENSSQSLQFEGLLAIAWEVFDNTQVAWNIEIQGSRSSFNTELPTPFVSRSWQSLEEGVEIPLGEAVALHIVSFGGNYVSSFWEQNPLTYVVKIRLLDEGE